MSKAFDKVWHQGVILKLKQNGISGNLLNIIEDFLSDRYQRVVLNDQSSNWAAVNAGAPLRFISWSFVVFSLHQ